MAHKDGKRRSSASATRRGTGRTIAATEAAKNFGQLVNLVRETRTVYTVERGGVPVVQVAPVPSFSCTVADLVAALTSGRRLPTEYLDAVEAGMRALNEPAVPDEPWER